MSVREGMTIGEAAAEAGLPTKTLRYYEEIGLLVPKARAANGYRSYGPEQVRRLRFLRRARRLGFSIEECRELLALHAEGRPSAEVKALAEARIREIEERLRELESLCDGLRQLTTACPGDSRPDCPILAALADP